MRQDIILCQITSQKIPKDEYSVILQKNATSEGSLDIDSYIRANMVFTASINQITKKVCKVTDFVYAEVVKQIIRIIKQ